MTKLRDGAKFDDVARDMSEDKARQGMIAQHCVAEFFLTWASGGSLGWKIRGSLDAEFEKVAYTLVRPSLDVEAMQSLNAHARRRNQVRQAVPSIARSKRDMAIISSW